jgi:fatty acid desaturase
VRGGLFTDWILAGLNYQIEHHLFPSMPRPNLRRAQRLVESFCRQREIPYYQTDLITSYVEVFRHLDTISRTIRT